MNVRLTLVALVTMVAGAFSAHRAQTELDPVRRERSAALELLVMPSSETLRPASLGQARLLGEVLWLRAVLAFGERFDKNPSEDWRIWFDRMLGAVAGLDPTWRTVYFYGGTMLRINGGTKQSTRLFLQGSQQLEDDSYMPFSAGMTIYLAKGDLEAAARLVDEAAERGGPAWYSELAVKLRADGAGNRGAREFLVQELDHTEEPAQRTELERQIEALDRDEFGRRLTQVLLDHLDQGGSQPDDLQGLVDAGRLSSLPPVPGGGSWVIDPVGPEVLSSDSFDGRVKKDQRAGRAMLRWKAEHHQ